MVRRNNFRFNRYKRTQMKGRGGGRGGGRGRGRGRGRGGRFPRGRRPMKEERGVRRREFESGERGKMTNQYYQNEMALSISYEILKELISKDENEI